MTIERNDRRPTRSRLSAFTARCAAWSVAHPVLVVWICVVAPLISGLLAAIGTRWYPTGDMAQAELHVRGLWSHPPLVGAAGRIESDGGVQGSHPGPAFFVALWPVYALFGRSANGLMVSAFAVHAAALASVLWLAHRSGGRRLLAALSLTIALVVRSSGPAAFVEPWNPWFAVAPYALFLLVLCQASTLTTSSISSRPARWIALAVALASYAIQCHAGYAGVTLLPLAAVVGWWAWSARRALRPLLRGLTMAGGVGVVMWLPPLIDQWRRTPGNLSILRQHFGTPDEPTIPVSTAARIVASQLSLLGPWLTGPSLISRNAVGVVATMMLWGLAVRRAHQRRDQAALHMHAILALSVVAGVLSVLRIFGPYQEYTIRWFWVVTAFVVARSAVDLLHGVRPGTVPRSAGAVAAIAALVIVVLGTVQFGQRSETSRVVDSRYMTAIADETTAGLRSGGRYLVRWHDPVGLGALPFGMVLELERAGVTAGVDASFAAAALPHRVMPESSADGVLWVVQGERISAFRASPAMRLLATADLRTDLERARSIELRALLQRRFGELGTPEDYTLLDEQYGAVSLMFRVPSPPVDIADAVRELVGLRTPVAVFLGPPGVAAPTS